MNDFSQGGAVWLFSLTMLATLLYARPSRTQTQSSSTTKPQGSPVPEAESQLQKWTLSLSFLGRRAVSDDVLLSNVSLLQGGLDVSVGYSRETERGEVTLVGRASPNASRGFSPTANSVTYGGGLSGSHQASPSVLIAFGEDFSSGIDLSALTTESLVAPQLFARGSLSRVGLRYDASPRTTLDAEFHFTWTTLSNPVPVEGSQFVLNTETPSSLLPPRERFERPERLRERESEVYLPYSEYYLLALLASEGLRVPSLNSLSTGSVLTYSHQVSQRTTATATLDVNWMSFDSPDGPVTTLGQGLVYRAQGNLSWAVGRTGSLAVEYSFWENRAMEPRVTQHIAMVRWSRGVTPRFNMNLSGGVGYSAPQGLDSRELTPQIEAGFRADLSRSSSVDIRFTRQQVAALGYGRNLIARSLAASYAQRVGARVDATARAEAAESRDSFTGLDDVRALRYSGEVRVSLTSQVDLHGGYTRASAPRVGVSLGTRGTVTQDLFYVALRYARQWPLARSGSSHR